MKDYILVRITPNTLTDSFISIEQSPNLTVKLGLGNEDVGDLKIIRLDLLWLTFKKVFVHPVIYFR